MKEDGDRKMTVWNDLRDELVPGMIVLNEVRDEMAHRMKVLFYGCVETAQKLCCHMNFPVSVSTLMIIEKIGVGAKSLTNWVGNFHCPTN